MEVLSCACVCRCRGCFLCRCVLCACDLLIVLHSHPLFLHRQVPRRAHHGRGQYDGAALVYSFVFFFFQSSISYVHIHTLICWFVTGKYPDGLITAEGKKKMELQDWRSKLGVFGVTGEAQARLISTLSPGEYIHIYIYIYIYICIYVCMCVYICCLYVYR